MFPETAHYVRFEQVGAVEEIARGQGLGRVGW